MRDVDLLTGELLRFFSLFFLKENLFVGVGCPELADEFLFANIAFFQAVNPAAEHVKLFVRQIKLKPDQSTFKRWDLNCLGA